jgi:recombinational DNA repair protein (RecF pathway)
MYEQSSSAFVLGKENVSEHDSLVSLYSKDLGKVLARVTSGAKLHSKLMPHLQVGNKVAVRLVERKLLRVADAISFPSSGAKGDLKKRILALSLLSQLSVDNGPEGDVWHYLEKEDWSTIKLLKMLGLYADGAKCFLCKKGEADYFSVADSGFYCAKCSVGGKSNLMYQLL